MTIRSFFQPSLKTVEANGSITIARQSFAFMPTVYIVARNLCSFTRIKLPAASRNGVRAAKLQATHNQRFPSARIRIVPDHSSSSTAGLWSWNKETPVSANLSLSNTVAIPETLARTPMQSGVRLVKCLEGVEGEIWEDGTLKASRWWQKKPTQNDWQFFLRAGKLRDHNINAPVPDAEEITWRNDLPLVDKEPENFALTFSPGRVALCAAAILVFLASLQISQQFSHKYRIETINDQLAVVTKDNQAAYNARAQSLSELSNIEIKSSIDNPLEIIRVMNEITDSIPTSTAELSNINISERTMEARFRIIDALDITAIVETLEGSPILTEVFIERPNDSIFLVKGKIVDPDE